MTKKIFSGYLIGSLIILGVVLLLGIRYGAVNIPFKTIWQTFNSLEPQVLKQSIVYQIRLPRVLGAALIGASLAGSGVIMQNLTRNPLADSGLLGINAGAGLLLTLSFIWFPHLSPQQTALVSFGGASLAALLILGISLKTRLQQVTTIVLAGMAISSCLVALSEGLALMAHLNRDLAFWHFGGVAAITWQQLSQFGPWLLLGLLGSLALAPQLRLLQLEDELILSLGRRLIWIRLAGFGCVIIMAGAAVALVGSVAFVGLMVPHMARFLVGYDARKVMPLSLSMGASLVVLADLGARTINAPQEIPFGIIISLLGVPFFIYLARQEAD